VTEQTTTSKGVDYIVNSKKPYPEWLRNHTVFKENNRIEKVFPKVGLPNFKEPCDIMNSAEAMADATKLGNKLRQELTNAQRALYDKLDIALKSKEKDRNETCNKLQLLINLLNNVIYSLGFQDYIKMVEGRVVLKLRADIFNGEKNPVFRKDEAVLRVIGKLREMVVEQKVNFTQIDQMLEFKDFSRTNVPNKKYLVCFSSTGEDGAWDIGTISMRGVTSCQSWNAPQSRGLIGSISSKFCGVIYLSSDQEIPGYGSKMLQRCVVRFAIHRTTRKPIIILDRMYPGDQADTREAFKRILKEKSGLDVLYTGEKSNELNNYYIPDEPVRKYFRQGEFPYMDHAINVQAHSPSIKKAAAPILTALTEDFKKKVGSELDKMIKVKREMYDVACKRLETLRTEYAAEKAKWEEANKDKPEAERSKFELEEPKMDAELHAFFRGGLENLFKHCDKKHGKDSAGHVFASLILNNFQVPGADEIESKEEFHRKYLMGFLRDPKAVGEAAKKDFLKGSWMKSFPKSGEKFYNFVFSQMRGFVIGSCKDMIKKAN
jgi:hypothetical protein